MSTVDGFSLDHLDRLSDARGLFEHADGLVPRLEHGYCTDDNARMLAVTSREPDTGHAQRLSRLALRFLRDAQSSDGHIRNRMDASGRWLDVAGTEDCWGRSLWGFGVAAAHHANPGVRRWAARGFDTGAHQRSQYPRAMAFASLGAAEVLTVDPRNSHAIGVLTTTLDLVGPLGKGDWAWPEARLRYANATLAEAVIAAGAALRRPEDIERGLVMLEWLLTLETSGTHLSVVGMDGRDPGQTGPQFDQQPIEVAAMADACWRASVVTGDARWSTGLAMAAAWFTGDNDAGVAVYDTESGGGHDGLRADGVNLNQGAESTLAALSTMQRARLLVASA